jgi:hypothetical protein
LHPDVEFLDELSKASLGNNPETDDRPSGLEAALVEYNELLGLALPERKFHLPWLPEGGLAMAYGLRGLGKTMFALGLMSRPRLVVPKSPI